MICVPYCIIHFSIEIGVNQCLILARGWGGLGEEVCNVPIPGSVSLLFASSSPYVPQYLLFLCESFWLGNHCHCFLCLCALLVGYFRILSSSSAFSFNCSWLDGPCWLPFDKFGFGLGFFALVLSISLVGGSNTAHDNIMESKKIGQSFGEVSL